MPIRLPIASGTGIPPGNRLKPLLGKRAGEHSIRVNDQFRICFKWQGGDAFDVLLEDYH
ncbi:MAG: type II toxin-antitoxin system RelE/ParE family toxin [Usitatibacteraceae bacterium]